ncbi:MAG TPA: vitamin B12-dependent ribonucleotide reductase [Patescibacteria group bacterium]|nr:vitamin B12-dependent ribonucleotide reductase [Patescibacteria group bacterium]
MPQFEPTGARTDYEEDILAVLAKKEKASSPRASKSKTAERSTKAPKPRAGLTINRFFTKDIDGNPLDHITYEKRDAKIVGTDGAVIFEMKGAEVPADWSQMASDIVVSKYFRKAGVPETDARGEVIKDRNGKTVTGPEKSIRQVIGRLVGCWRNWGEKFNYFQTPGDAQNFDDELKYMLVKQIASPNSPQWFNTGLYWAYGIKGPAQGHSYIDPKDEKLVYSQDAYSHPQPHACFIQSIMDNLVEKGGIMDLVVKEARIFKYGSGSGSNFSALRSEGEPLSGGGKSSGLMSWLKIFDRSAGAIKSGGTSRRAAKMACLDIDHPDVEEFITWKKNEEKKVAALIAAGYDSDFNGEAYQTVSGQNANNSVRVTEEFLESVKKGKDWPMRWRTDPSHIAKTAPAKELWDLIADAAWHCADPGVQYDTTINQWHTCPASGRINASNPCSEYMFLDDTACNLASINLVKFYDDKTGKFDVGGFRHAVHIWTIVLEISVLMAQFISEEMAEKSYEFRPLGLGYANLGALLIKNGLPYDSDEGRAMATAITAIMTGEAYASSALLAKNLGPFAGFAKNKKHMMRVIRNHRRAAYGAPDAEYDGLSIKPWPLDQKITPDYLLDAAHRAWDKALAAGDEFGYRNAQVTLIAPTGTIGLAMDCDTTGVEPDFALVKFKKLAGGGYMKIINQSVPGALNKLGYNPNQTREILNFALGRGTLRGAPHINHETLTAKGLTSQDLENIEQQLPAAFELKHAFNQFNLGKETMERLGFKADEYGAPSFDMLSALGFSDKEILAANRYVCGTMTLEGAPHIKEENLAVFDCANKCGQTGTRFIHYMGHLKMMASVQPFLSGAISKTINLTNDATVEEVAEAYWQGWEMGLKAVALYRDGSKLSQPLSGKIEQASAKDTAANLKETAPEPVPTRKRPPKERQSITRKVTIGGHKLYVTVGLYPDGTPAEIFVNMAQEGSFASGMADAFAKITSIGLQYGVPVETIIKQLEHMRFDPHGFTGDSDIPFATSVADFIAQWLRKTFTESGAPAKITLPMADSAPLPALAGDAADDNIPSQSEPATLPFTNIANQAASAALGDSGPPCPECGAVMIPNGRCHKCPNCGATSGCS